MVVVVVCCGTFLDYFFLIICYIVWRNIWWDLIVMELDIACQPWKALSHICDCFIVVAVWGIRLDFFFHLMLVFTTVQWAVRQQAISWTNDYQFIDICKHHLRKCNPQKFDYFLRKLQALMDQPTQICRPMKLHILTLIVSYRPPNHLYRPK